MILVFRDVFTIFLCLHIHTHRSLSSLSFSLGNVGSPQNPDVSIGPGLRFFLLPTDQLSRPLTLLAHHSHPTFRSDFLHFCIDFMSDETVRTLSAVPKWKWTKRSCIAAFTHQPLFFAIIFSLLIVFIRKWLKHYNLAMVLTFLSLLMNWKIIETDIGEAITKDYKKSNTKLTLPNDLAVAIVLSSKNDSIIMLLFFVYVCYKHKFYPKQ